MTKNFFEFHDTFASSDEQVAKVMLPAFQKKYSKFEELDCDLLTVKDFQNLLIMEQFMGQDNVYFTKLEKELTKVPRTKHIREIQNSCMETISKLPKVHLNVNGFSDMPLTHALRSELSKNISVMH